MTETLETTRIRYLSSIQRIADSLELIAYDNALDIGPDGTSELVNIVVKINKFVDETARKTGLGARVPSRLH